MYQELTGGLLLRGQEEERERLRKRISRLRQLEDVAASAPGWRGPAPAIEREPEPVRDVSCGPLPWPWVLAMRLATAKI